ncbi:MAG: hypothetical protein ACYC9X_00680 [Dehalococcoidia bacterium]
MAASTQIDQTSALDNLKQTYLELKDLRLACTTLQDLIPGSRGGEVGAKVNIPVLLTHQTSETYGLAGNTDTLRAPKAIQIIDASSDQYETTLPVRIPTGYMSKVEQSGKARFADKAKLLMLAGKKGALRVNELHLLHGSNSYAKIGSLAASTGPVGGIFSRVVTPTAGTWSDGIWGGADSAPIDAYSALSGGVKHNTAGDLTVGAVDFAAKTITLQSATQADLDALAVSDFLFPAGSYGLQMPGLMNIISTTTGSIFGISTNYTLWKAKQVTVTGPITIGKLISGVSPAIAHGADGTMKVLVSPRNWADLNKDCASGRRFDYSYKPGKLTNGAKKLEIESANVDLEIVLHPFMKDGEIAAIMEANWFRPGSQPDPSMMVGGERLQVMSATTNSFEFREWSAQVLMPNMLATSVYFSGITPNSN